MLIELSKEKMQEEVQMSIKAFFVDFYGTIVHEDGEVIKKITDIICKRIEQYDVRPLGQTADL